MGAVVGLSTDIVDKFIDLDRVVRFHVTRFNIFVYIEVVIRFTWVDKEYKKRLYSWNFCLPEKEWASVPPSTYSNSPPSGTPWAMRVTLVLCWRQRS